MGAEETRKLVVYYSLDGSTRFVAQAIAEETGADLLELQPRRPMPAGGLRYALGGMQAVFGARPALQALNRDPDEYDLVFIGTPIWASRMTPAVRSFLLQANLKGKKVALFCTFRGNPGKTFETMRESLAGNEIVGQTEFLEPLKNETENTARAQGWAREMVSRAR
jgi:flavodoxin